jgi:hypothetical protein
MLNFLITLSDNWTPETYLTIFAKNMAEAKKIADRLKTEIKKPIANVKCLDE